MKTHAQTHAGLKHLATLIEPMSVAMLTTADDAGLLVSRPMSPLEMDADGAIWFFTDERSAKVEHLHAVNLAFSAEADASYVSLAGYGEIHTGRAQIERLWTPFAKPWFPDGPGSAHLALLKVVPDTAAYWDAPNSVMVRLFAMAASVIAGKPIGLGTQGTLTDLAPAG
jgi:general stress protein 26